MTKPVVLVSSWARDCGIATFAEEAVASLRDPLRKTAKQGRRVHVISHTDGHPLNGETVYPIMDPSHPQWEQPVLEQIIALDPYVVHFQHEYGLYDEENGTLNPGFLRLLKGLNAGRVPTVVEPHTIHSRPNQKEEAFINNLLDQAGVVVVKEPFLRMRLHDWVLAGHIPDNIAVIRHGVMPHYANKYKRKEVLEELGLQDLQSKNIALLVGWIQSNKRWDYVLEQWPDIAARLKAEHGGDWVLLAAGKLRDPANHQRAYERYMGLLAPLIKQGLGRFYEFTPRNARYYMVLSLADFVVLPSIDETQSGTLARIIALNKPYVTFPVEGLGYQTAESQGGLIAVDEEALADRITDLATNPKLRARLAHNQRDYLNTRVGWDIVGRLYVLSYEAARKASMNSGTAHITMGDPLYNGHF